MACTKTDSVAPESSSAEESSELVIVEESETAQINRGDNMQDLTVHNKIMTFWNGDGTFGSFSATLRAPEGWTVDSNKMDDYSLYSETIRNEEGEDITEFNAARPIGENGDMIFGEKDQLYTTHEVKVELKETLTIGDYPTRLYVTLEDQYDDEGAVVGQKYLYEYDIIVGEFYCPVFFKADEITEENRVEFEGILSTFEVTDYEIDIMSLEELEEKLQIAEGN